MVWYGNASERGEGIARQSMIHIKRIVFFFLFSFFLKDLSFENGPILFNSHMSIDLLIMTLDKIIMIINTVMLNLNWLWGERFGRNDLCYFALS